MNRSAAIGGVDITERLPSGYKLVVGGKVLAEEVRITLVKDWPDAVSDRDYPLQRLADLEQFIWKHTGSRKAHLTDNK